MSKIGIHGNGQGLFFLETWKVVSKRSKTHYSYFKLILDETLNSIDKFVALFDESFNPLSKTGQIDLHIKFWHTINNCVATCYFNSEFMGKSSGQDIYEKFEQCLEKSENNK